MKLLENCREFSRTQQLALEGRPNKIAALSFSSNDIINSKQNQRYLMFTAIFTTIFMLTSIKCMLLPNYNLLTLLISSK